MAVVSRFSIQCQTKSISLPSRSHPTTLQIEELLNKIKTTSSFRPSAQTICSGLSQLTELYKCMDDLLNSSTVRILMARQQNAKWVDELIDESVKFLDICGGIWDMMSQIKEQIRDLHCALRRRNGDQLSSENGIITKYICFRKKMKKDVKGLVANLKQVDNNMTGGGSMVVDSDNHHLAAVMKAVLGVSETTISVFESLLMFFSMPAVSKPNKWSFVVSKLIHKGMVACEAQQKQAGSVNELESIDAELQNLCKYGLSNGGGNVLIAQSRFERLGAQIESMESGLECMFRCLVRTRASLLNIISQ